MTAAGAPNCNAIEAVRAQFHYEFNELQVAPAVDPYSHAGNQI
jgi:hypothetical protein